MPTTLTLPLVV